jgi:tRNA A37 methylthiotransferase MiaB
MDGELSVEVIKRRSRELRALAASKQAAFSATQVGKTLCLLTLRRQGEDQGGAWTGALASNYVNVRVAGLWPPNQMLAAQITSAQESRLTGKP